MDAENKSEESVMDFFTPLLARFDKIYYDLAKRHGESYFDMWVLEEIGDKPEGVTQKQLCEILYSPKQTVNSLVASLCGVAWWKQSPIAPMEEASSMCLLRRGRKSSMQFAVMSACSESIR